MQESRFKYKFKCERAKSRRFKCKFKCERVKSSFKCKSKFETRRH